MTDDEMKEIYALWVEAWNTDSRLVEEIAHPNCLVHQVRTDEESATDLKGSYALKDILVKAKVLFDRVTMTVDVGPITQGGYLSARWTFSGNYLGGLPGSQAKAGKPIAFSGQDMMYMQEGKITDYWVSSDGVHLLEQLEVL